MSNKAPLPGRWSRVRTRARKAGVTIGPALRTVGPYVSIGLFVGASLLSLSMVIERYAALRFEEWFVEGSAKFCEHLGAGFFVSSVAVFLYEWGAEAKQLLAITHRLARLADEELKPLLDAHGRDAVALSMQRLAPELRDQFLAILDAVVVLRSSGHWSGDVYGNCVARLLTRIADDASQVGDLFYRLRADPSDPVELTLSWPRASFIADHLLGAELSLLGRGDSLRALSDVSSWEEPFDRFVAEQKLAVTERGVQIRRLFLVPKMATGDTGGIIARHWTMAAQWTAGAVAAGTDGLYALRVITEDTFLQSAPELQSRRHFAIFKKTLPDGDSTLAFQAIVDNLSEMRLSAADERSRFSKDFERLWKSLDGQGPAKIANILLASEARALEDGRFNIVSDFDSWRNGRLDTYHRECMNAVGSRGSHGRRVFVLGERDPLASVREILERHEADAAKYRTNVKSNTGTYEIRLASETVAKALFGDNWQFGIFVRSKREPQPVGFMVADGPQGVADFYIEPVSVDLVARKFDTLWASAVASKRPKENIEKWIARVRV